MSCKHKFWNYHDNGLFPNWEFDILIIGTFNPEWKKITNNTARYFYGRTRNNYMWKVLPEAFGVKKLTVGASKEGYERNWFDFLQKHKIAFTDLIIEIKNIVTDSEDDLKRISSFKDEDLKYYQEHIVWNDISIYLDSLEVKPRKIYFTRDATGFWEEKINEIIKYGEEKNIEVRCLHSPSKQAIRGSNKYETLKSKWKEKGFIFKE